MNERSRRLREQVLGTTGLKALGLALGFATTPAYLVFIPNASVLGAWFALLSLLNWVLFFDFGIHSAFRNRATSYFEDGRWQPLRELVGATYQLSLIIAVILAIVGAVGVEFVNWNQFFRIDHAVVTADELSASMYVVFLGMIGQLLLRVVSALLLAMQKNVLVSVFPVLTQAAILFFLVIAPPLSAPAALWSVSVVSAVSGCAPLIMATFWVFARGLPKATPVLFKVSSLEIRGVLTTGTSFFLIQLALLVINATDPWIISYFFGAADVVDFQIYHKFYSVPLILFLLLVQPVWSAVSSALVRNDVEWIRRVGRKLLILAAVTGVVSCAVAPLVPFIFRLWLGEDRFQGRPVVALFFGLWVSIQILVHAGSTVANGLGLLWPQVYCLGLAAILKLPLIIVLTHVSGSWLTVVVASTLLLLPQAVIQPVLSGRALARYAHCQGGA